MEHLEIDTEMAIAHLKALGYADDEMVYLRKFPPKGVKNGSAATLESPLNKLPRRQKPDGGLYFVVNGGGQLKADVKAPKAFFFEWDDRPIDEQINGWQKFGMPVPTIQVQTRKSVHNYYTIKGNCSLEQWDVLQLDLIDYLDSDRQLKDRNRVMRLAGAWHIDKDAPPVQCKIISHSGFAYSFEELRAIVPPRPTPESYVEKQCNGNQSLSDFLQRDLLPRFTSTAAFNWPGHNWQGNPNTKMRGCCPWHESQSGTAFYVEQKNGIWLWRCPACEIGGTVVEYRHRLKGGTGYPKGKDFVELLKELSSEVGVTFPDRIGQPSSLKDAIAAKHAAGETELTAAEIAANLKKAVAEYVEEPDPFLKALMENAIARDYNVRGARLQQLIDQLNPAKIVPGIEMGDLMVKLFQKIEERALNPGMPGVTSGFKAIDDMTGGWQRGDLILVAGRPSMGKSSFVLNVAYNAAKAGVRTGIFSVEMNEEDLGFRLISSVSRVPFGRLKSGHINPDEWGIVADAIAVISDGSTKLHGTSVNTIEAIVDAIANEPDPFGLVVIDYLQMISTATPGDNRNIELSRITRTLKQVALSQNIPIICLSQLSRGVESRSDKRPMMSDLRDSGAIEQDADLIAMLYRDEYYNPDSVDCGLAEVIISKHRNGPVGTVKLIFDAKFMQFQNVS